MQIFLFIFSLIISINCGFAQPTLDTPASISFLPPQELHIARQDIQIGEKLVTVNYAIKNKSAVDSSMVLSMTLPWQNSNQKTPINPNPKILVNSKPVKLQSSTQAISPQGRDITELLKKHLIPLNPVQAKRVLQLKKFSNLKRPLAKLNLVDDDMTPTWKAQTIYYWQQRFPAASTVLIQQQFQPVVKHFSELNNKVLRYCNLEPETKFNGRMVNFSFLDNFTWAKPIERFTLRLNYVENTAPSKVCWNHPMEHLDDNQLVFSAKSFRPMEDLKLIWID